MAGARKNKQTDKKDRQIERQTDRQNKGTDRQKDKLAPRKQRNDRDMHVDQMQQI